MCSEMGFCSSIFACVWILIGSALNGLSCLIAIYQVVFLHSVSHFSLLINFTEGQNIVGFLPPQLPRVISLFFDFSQLFLPSAQSFIWLLASLLFSHFPLSTCIFPGYKEKASQTFWACSMVYELCFSFQFTRSSSAEELQLVWTAGTPLPFSGAAMLYSSRRPGGL